MSQRTKPAAAALGSLLTFMSTACSAPRAAAPPAEAPEVPIASASLAGAGARALTPDVSSPRLAFADRSGRSSETEARADVQPSLAERRAPASAAFAERQSYEALDRASPLLGIRDDPRGKLITFASDELFPPGQATLTAGTMFRLDELASLLRDLGRRTVFVRGYTDTLGDQQQNEQLSRLRAEAVRDCLVAHGASTGRVRAEGIGGQSPVADNQTPEGRSRNRRIEVLIER